MRFLNTECDSYASARISSLLQNVILATQPKHCYRTYEGRPMNNLYTYVSILYMIIIHQPASFVLVNANYSSTSFHSIRNSQEMISP